MADGTVEKGPSAKVQNPRGLSIDAIVYIELDGEGVGGDFGGNRFSTFVVILNGSCAVLNGSVVGARTAIIWRVCHWEEAEDRSVSSSFEIRGYERVGTVWKGVEGVI